MNGFKGRHPLHLAASDGKLSVVSELLKESCDPDVADHQGFRPLHVAAQQGFVEIVQLLKDAGAKLEAQTKTGLQAVHLAAGRGHVAVLKQLQSYHCNLAVPDNSSATPLHHAAENGKQSAVEWLIEAGVSPNMKDERGMSAADLAEEKEFFMISGILNTAMRRASIPKATLRKQASHLDSTHERPKLPRVPSRTSDSSVDALSLPLHFPPSTPPFASDLLSQNTHVIFTSTIQSRSPAVSPTSASSQNSTPIGLQPSLTPQSPESPIVLSMVPPKSPTQLQKSSDIHSSAREQEKPKDTVLPPSPHSSPLFPKSPSITNLSSSGFFPSSIELHPFPSPSPSEIDPSCTPIFSSNTPPSSTAQSDPSPYPTTPASNSIPSPNEGAKPKEKDEKKKKKKGKRTLSKILRGKSSQVNKVAKKEAYEQKNKELSEEVVAKKEVYEQKIKELSEEVVAKKEAYEQKIKELSEEVVAKEEAYEQKIKELSEEVERLKRMQKQRRDSVDNVKFSAESKEREGSGLGHGEGSVSGDSPHGQPQEDAVMNLQVQPATLPIPEGPDVYPCYTNPRGLVLILNNKSFSDFPNLTRFGSECDSINLENVYQQMGYEVRTRFDLTRQDTLDYFLKASKSPILKNVSCLFVFILSHGDGSRTFLTHDNDKVTLDEVQSCFLDQSSPNLRGKPKFFFSHFCRGSDEEIRPALFPDAKREAYRDMLCLYSATEGFQAYRHGRLGTPSVRALCQTLARYANCKKLCDVIKEFQRLYETMEGATSPEVQNFTFDKDFFFNPIGKK